MDKEKPRGTARNSHGVWGRGTRNRTRNLHFWRVALCLIELYPYQPYYIDPRSGLSNDTPTWERAYSRLPCSSGLTTVIGT